MVFGRARLRRSCVPGGEPKLPCANMRAGVVYVSMSRERNKNASRWPASRLFGSRCACAVTPSEEINAVRLSNVGVTARSSMRLASLTARGKCMQINGRVVLTRLANQIILPAESESTNNSRRPVMTFDR